MKKTKKTKEAIPTTCGLHGLRRVFCWTCLNNAAERASKDGYEIGTTNVEVLKAAYEAGRDELYKEIMRTLDKYPSQRVAGVLVRRVYEVEKGGQS